MANSARANETENFQQENTWQRANYDIERGPDLAGYNITTDMGKV